MQPITCPRCRTHMAPADREGVEVDVCRTCLGVWFDRGEIDRVFHRLTAVDPADLPANWEPLDDLHHLGRPALAR